VCGSLYTEPRGGVHLVYRELRENWETRCIVGMGQLVTSALWRVLDLPGTGHFGLAEDGN